MGSAENETAAMDVQKGTLYGLGHEDAEKDLTARSGNSTLDGAIDTHDGTERAGAGLPRFAHELRRKIGPCTASWPAASPGER